MSAPRKFSDYCPGLPTLPHELLQRLTYDPSEDDQAAGSQAIRELCELIRARPRYHSQTKPVGWQEYSFPVVSTGRIVLER